ncbi:MAG TPA: ATPase, T2SS/T4P/T4SS family [Solirubrobacteraceae bacterium]|nr:ATPase, T2SS/T4P/T4SS family [Solirubrobacteraceae bacterium]
MLPEPIPLKPTTSDPENATGITHPRRTGGPARFLTDVIVDLGLVARERVAAAVEEGRRTGKMPEQVLVEQGALTADGLSRAVAERHGLDHLDLGTFNPDMAAANLISIAAAKRYEAVPVGFLNDRTLLVAMADPANVLAVDDIALLTGKEIRPAVTSRDDILNLISRLTHLEDVVASDIYEDEEEAAADVVDLRESADDAPVIRLVNQIIAQAAEQGASDIHLEPNGHELRVRFRIDGVLVETATIQRRMVLGVISRVKIMSDLDISERRIPQDGRVGLTIDGHHIDLRVVTLPSVHGESVVIRILDKSAIVMELEKLGMAAPERERFERAFHQSFGAVLVTGPTGSGKSTTLYAALAALNTIEKNIITIEDPVEYQLEGITQVQVNPKAGLHFHTGLRSMMRADPDIIMVGEIRDRETAQIAIESALTGHLVLSTLHTNDAASAVTRLVDMGVEPFLVASAIDCVVAQRLARKLCQHCKERGIISADILRANGIRSQFDMETYEPAGCSRCNHTGYKGRIGLYEVMVISEEIRKLTLARAAGPEIAEVAVRQGMRLMRDDGLEKVRHGMTSIAEVTRVAGTGAAPVES